MTTTATAGCRIVHAAPLEEYWRSIEDAPSYLASDLGRVARLRPDGTWRLLRQSRNDKGYLKVCLGRGRQEYVHRLVALAFIGPPPSEEHQVDHHDDNQLNNRLDNLKCLHGDHRAGRWGSRRSPLRVVLGRCAPAPSKEHAHETPAAHHRDPRPDGEPSQHPGTARGDR